ncbi:hypothetical protein [Devosia sp.]|uniref:hypothetical protein n=1 Tax=Devosia sp. TaxID=1871048 RepID=UPI003266B3AB
MSAEVAALRKFPSKLYAWSFAAIVLLGIWPLLSVLVTSSLAEAHGCLVDEGSVHPCIIMGSDWGEALYAMGVMGWFMLLTFPLAAGLSMIWAIALIIHHSVWLRRQRSSA